MFQIGPVGGLLGGLLGACWEGIRELLQNFRDELIEGLNISINETTISRTENVNQVNYDVSYNG